jgi:uncharacterized protein (TIGR03435 family)
MIALASCANLARAGAVALVSAMGPHKLAGAPQSPAATEKPKFEVASIKVNGSGDTASRSDFSGANVVFRNYVLGGILQSAFNVERLSLEAPDWVYGERFDITAKVPDENASLDQRRQMLQALLIDRFGLVFHHETKARAGFALVVAKNGPKIQPVEDAGGHINDNRPGKMQRLRTTVDGFASTVAGILRQPVVDETHMEGRYNMVLTYAPERGPGVPPADDDAPSIFTAIEEQLGLKLEPRKVPVDILVVDHLEKLPTDN